MSYLVVFYKFFQLAQRLVEHKDSFQEFNNSWHRHPSGLATNPLKELIQKYAPTALHGGILQPADLLIKTRHEVLAHDGGTYDDHGCPIPILHSDPQRLKDFFAAMEKIFPLDPYLVEMLGWV